MDFTLNEDQVQIARQARRFFENECPIKYVRAMFEDERGYTDDVWSKMAEMGWMGIRVPEAYGGMAMELVDLCVILEEMGRAVYPGPFFSTVLLASEILREAGNDSQKQSYLSRIAGGELKGTLALQEADGGPDPSYIQMSASPQGGAFVLDGAKLFVTDAHVADFLICAARTEPGSDPARGVTLFLLDKGTPGLAITPLRTMDGTRKQCEVRFDKVRVAKDRVLGEVNQGWAPLSRALRKAQVALCAEGVGGAEKAMEIAVEYAKIRIQFGQPIGSFQAIKHQCAEMLREVEAARSIMYWAAWAQDHEEPKEAALAASVAKAYCTEAFKNVTAAGIQVLGGVGFTWEHDMHLYFKRAKANEVAFGDPAYHREQVAQLLGC